MEDSDLAEFIGIMLGDGSIGRYRCSSPEGTKIQHRVKVTLSADEKRYAHHVASLMEAVLEIEPHIREKATENVIEILTFKRDAYSLLIDDIGLIPAPKKNRAQIPERFLEYAPEVLRGYFDTDGSVVITDNNGTMYPRVEMKVMPAPMQEQIVSMVFDVEERAKRYEIGDGHIRIQMNGKDVLKKWFDSIKPHNNKHKEKASQVIAGARFERATSGL